MNIDKIDIKDIEFGEPIEKKEPTYRDGYIRGIYRAKNIIDSKQKEIERLNNIINELEKYVIDREERSWDDNGAYDDVLDKLQELKGDGGNE